MFNSYWFGMLPGINNRADKVTMRFRFLHIIILVLSLLATQSAYSSSFNPSTGLSFGQSRTSEGNGQDFLSPQQAFQYQLEHTDDGDVLIHWQIEPGYYLYRKRLNTGDAESELPDGTTIEDEFFGLSEVYKDDFSMLVRSGGSPFTLTWQGCAEAGLCYPPVSDAIESDPAASALDRDTPSVAADLSISQRLASSPLGWTLAGFFLMGLLLTFTPCVLPMIPIISSIVVGSGVRGKKALLLSLAYVVPMALTYALLGIVAASAGASIQVLMQSPWVLGSFAIFFVLFALAMFGAFEMQLPNSLRQRLDALNQKQNGGHLRGAAILGVLSAILVGPCMTAPLAGALLYIGQSGDIISGGLALFSLGMGMGVPLVIVGTLGGQLLPKPGTWMNRVKALFGFILLGTAIWFLQRVLPVYAGQILWASLALGFTMSIYLSTRSNWVKTISSVLSVWAVLAMAVVFFNSYAEYAFFDRSATSASTTSTQSAAVGQQSFQPLESVQQLNEYISQAKEEERYIFIDFYADWCVSCIAMERNVFSRADVQQTLSPMVRLKPDVTANNAEDRELMRHLSVMGPPTMIIIDPDGVERRNHRIIGEVNATELMQTLDSLTEPLLSEQRL
ncbi:thiol:disulfide interchange protein [Aliidiomarina sedimenti]|uniref:Thiol:disulfide interchange protein DsbD n=1 Tax=Aliidiomarina sedimenti TaxID=1933879 RepID=A0ABY0BXH3_9GAMM|nr:protein-disulfide reductase DsbD [Aliidiomarina sedimenti]RUO28973.1 thiol:disulfide interchange protein [Aliidiomarina sedimenti]